MASDTHGRDLQVGFVGTGYIADWHAKALDTIPGVKLAAVCDKDLARARAFASRRPGVRAHDSLEAMLDGSEPALDAVHVLVPPDLHASVAASLIGRRIQVFLEKPMAVSVEECDKLLELAGRTGTRVGVNHNFLYSPVYERLREDFRAGKLGRPDHITVTWHRELGQLQSGPFDLWMLRDPRNIILEIGPHCLAPLLDLLGPLKIVGAHAGSEIALPSGQSFYRRWTIVAEAGDATAVLNLSFKPGFTEQLIHIRGSLAGATVDFERDTYLLHQHTPHELDLDRFHMTRHEAKSLAAQARRGVSRYVLSKLKLSREGSPYGSSISRAARAFHLASEGEVDRRISPELGRDVMSLCCEIGRLGAGQTAERPQAAESRPAIGLPSPAAEPPEILVLGATGFIGQALARQLVEEGRRIRILVRNPSKVPADLVREEVEIVRGDLTREQDLEEAIAGCQFVYHLARPYAKTWDEFQRQDIDVTRMIGELSLKLGVKRLIYTGTIDSYYAGSKAGTITEETALDPQIAWRNLYARSKAASEEILWTLHKERGLPLVVFRPGIVLGRGGSPFHWGIGMWSWNAICRIWGRGDHPLPFVLVEDVARALVLALQAPGIEGEAFNLVAETELSARDYLQALEAHAGVAFQKLPTPPWKFYVTDLGKWVVKRLVRHPDQRRPSYRDWETRTQRARYDCTKAREMLGWRPVTDREALIRLGIHEPCSEFIGVAPARA